MPASSKRSLAEDSQFGFQLTGALLGGEEKYQDAAASTAAASNCISLYHTEPICLPLQWQPHGAASSRTASDRLNHYHHRQSLYLDQNVGRLTLCSYRTRARPPGSGVMSVKLRQRYLTKCRSPTVSGFPPEPKPFCNITCTIDLSCKN
jgi:hypothetical protein